MHEIYILKNALLRYACCLPFYFTHHVTELNSYDDNHFINHCILTGVTNIYYINNVYDIYFLYIYTLSIS